MKMAELKPQNKYCIKHWPAGLEVLGSNLAGDEILSDHM